MGTIPTMPGAGESRLLKIRQLLAARLHIPQFQRPYDWGLKQVDEFVADLAESSIRRAPLFLGLVVLHGGPAGHAVIDGQQRLTTIMLALAASGGSAHILRTGEGPTTPWIRPRVADAAFTKALITGAPEDAQTLSQQLIASAFARLTVASPSLDALLDCEVIVYVAPQLAGATRLFERINLRGKDVSEFDLVKNRLIESATQIPGDDTRRDVEDFITERYDKLYKLLDPRSGTRAYDSDKLLKLHWILFSPTQFKSGERVLSRVSAWMDRPAAEIAHAIETYLDSLVQVAQVWTSVERPYDCPRPEPELNAALLDFARLGREGELQPLLVAAILAFGGKAHTLVRFCEINSLRSALAQKNTNYGRALKWRLARQLHARTLRDARGRPVTTPEGVVHQLFWLNTPWWSHDEADSFDDPISPEQARSEILPDEALDSPKFLKQHRNLVHYLFWNYGLFLQRHERWGERVKVDISQFQESVWYGDHKSSFRRWDIEHIYPQRPDDRGTRAGRKFQLEMADWLNHLGNLTVLPIVDNRGVGNADFKSKLAWMQDQHKVPFNELLADRAYTGNLVDKPHWGPHNCRKRAAHLREFAAEVWGTEEIRRLGVGEWDDRVDGSGAEDAELEDAATPAQGEALKALVEAEPALLRMHITGHPGWQDFQSDFGLAGPHKLILSEAIEYVEAMAAVTSQFPELGELDDSLAELLKALEDANDDPLLPAADDDASPFDQARTDAEADFAEYLLSGVHSLIDYVSAAQDDLPFESDELDDGTRAAAAAVEDALTRLHKLINMLFEQWDGSR